MKRRPLIFIVAALALAGGAFLLFGGDKRETAPVVQPDMEADRSEGQVGALGRIEPRSRVVRVSHDAGPEGARIGELKVAEGDRVEAGAVIAVFSDYPRKQAKAEAATARIAMLEAKLKAEESNASFFAKEFERYRVLAKTQAVSVARKDQAERDYRQSQAQVTSLKAELASSQAEAKLANEEFSQSQLVAPLAGTIVKIHAWPGERVGDAGVVEMADLTQLDVVAEIYERDMPRVRVGQQAVIKVPGFEESFSGEVRELGFQVRKNDVNDTDPLADRDNRVVEVRITLPPAEAEKLKHLIYLQVDVRLQ